MTPGEATEDQKRRIQEALETAPFAKLNWGLQLPSPVGDWPRGATSRVLWRGSSSAEVLDNGRNLAATALST